jgi:hypothetical protein
MLRLRILISRGASTEPRHKPHRQRRIPDFAMTCSLHRRSFARQSRRQLIGFENRGGFFYA